MGDGIEMWQRMYARAITRHHDNIDAVLHVIASGGDTRDVVSCIVNWLDGMDALIDDDGLTRRAWLASGGTDDDYPVVDAVEDAGSGGVA